MGQEMCLLLGQVSLSLLFWKKNLPTDTENSMQYGYDENDNNNMSNETKRETNYSINKNNTRYMQLTKYNKYTNDDICTNAGVVHMIH